MRREKMGINELTVNWCSLHAMDRGIGDAIYLDGVGGSNGNSGRTPGTALKTPGAALSAIVADQLDTVFVLPNNTFTLTGAAPITWNKDHTRIIGLGNNYREQVIRTISDDGAFAFLNTADNVEIYNIQFAQWGENAACLTAFKEQGKQNTYINCHFFGDIRSESATGADGAAFCSLHIDTTVGGAGAEDKFIDCVMGDLGGTARTGARKGVILFGLTGVAAAGKDVLFRRCKVLSRSTDADMSAFMFSANYCRDRLLEIDDCVFYNYYAGDGFTKLTEVINDDCTTDHANLIRANSTNFGWTNWDSLSGGDGRYSYTDMPQPNAGGGITAMVT